MKKVLPILGIAAVALIGAWLIFFSGEKEDAYTTVEAIRGDLIQTVAETGQVKPIKELQLKFKSTGKVDQINVKVGDEVETDQILAALDLSDIEIKLQEATANLAMAQAQLDKLLSGASREELAVAKANLEQAENAYETAKTDSERIDQVTAENVRQARERLNDLQDNSQSTLTAVEQSVIQASNSLGNTKTIYASAVDNKVESLITTMENQLAVANTALESVGRLLNDSSINSYFSIKNTQVLNDLNLSYNQAKSNYADSKADVLQLSASADAVTAKQTYEDVKDTLNMTFTALNHCYNALENSTTGGDFTQAVLDGHKTTINTKLTAVSSGITSLQTAKQALNDAELNYATKVTAAEDALVAAQASLDDAIDTAQDALKTAELNREQQITTAAGKEAAAYEAMNVARAQYEKLAASARSEDLDLQRAKIEQTQASIDLLTNQQQDLQIIAPLDGVVTKVEYEEGEQAVAGQVAVTMMADRDYEVEIDVSETDIAKIEIDDPAVISFDAYSEAESIEGRVAFIEPAETEIQGVVYYKVKMDFDPGDLEIRPGMTATAEITTDRRKDVIIIPLRAVIEEGKNGSSRQIVRVLEGDKPEERAVELGLYGDGGLVEVISGIEPGDQVITFVQENGD